MTHTQVFGRLSTRPGRSGDGADVSHVPEPDYPLDSVA
jgi:hypothetical protein